MDYYCDTCNKTYSSYQSLWIHNKKYHNKKNSVKENEDKPNNKNTCIYCNKMFTFYQSKWRHEKKCDKQNFSKNIENKFKQIETKLKEIDTFLSKTNLLNINTLLEDDEESELIKIQYKKNFYYLDNNMLYEITDGKKGKLFAHYSNGKVVIIKEKEIDL